jgi:subtilase family serine protease
MTCPRPRRRVLRPAVDRLDDRLLLSGLTPAQVTRAYGLNALTFTAGGQVLKGNGSGETIAIVDALHDPFITSDLSTFDQANGLAGAALTQINLAGSKVNSGWAQEEALDVEWAHAIAPGANLIVVEAKTDSTKDLLAAVDVARNQPGVVAVSMSWGGAELSNELSLNSHFTTPPGHPGITFITASGDEGSAGGSEWPSASARVLSVGGTTLTVDSAGNYQAEAAWSGSSGGFSRYVSEPSFQSSVQSSGHRVTPDVAFVADPNTGVEVYATDPTIGSGSWVQIGGTSVGSPTWAGIIAIADQERAAHGMSSLDGATQTLPTLYALPASDFHNVGSLTTTGLGTPVGAALVEGLASSTLTTVNPSISVRIRFKHASGARAPKGGKLEARWHSAPAVRHAFDVALRELVRESLRGS